MQSHPLFEFERTGEKLISAKQLNVGVCDLNKAIEMNVLWHSVFPKIEASNCYRNKICIAFACEFDGEFYASAIWTSPIAANRLKDGDKLLELRRMAICDKAPKYTATRFLSMMQKHIKKKFPELTGLISYQDAEKHTGTIYKASNWVIDNKAEFSDWTTSTRKRAKSQSETPKIRWKYSMNSTGEKKEPSYQ